MKKLYNLYKDKSQNGLNYSLSEACREGDLEAVKFLLTSDDLMFNAQINCENNDPLFQACDYDRMEIIKYLLTSDELKNHADKYFALKLCCEEDKIEILEFLLKNSALDIDIHIDNSILFELALSNKSNNVLNYLIFNENIERTSRINDLVNKYKNDQVKNWFDLREVNKELNKDLVNNHLTTKKLKV
jgi:ankyrin repeat protein